jgi:LAGLIDADG endonuclease
MYKASCKREGNTVGSRPEWKRKDWPRNDWGIHAEMVILPPSGWQICDRHHTPVISVRRWPMDIKAYLSGYTDGEGCFCVSINKSNRHKFGWEIRPSFSVSQNGDRAEVLEILKQYFACGTIRPDRSDKTLKYEVWSLTDLVGRVIPHFEENPLFSSKQQDFELFAEICRLMYRGEHLTEEGFKHIVALALEMNPSGKRKYTEIEVKL